jgi:hypothetical protein
MKTIKAFGPSLPVRGEGLGWGRALLNPLPQPPLRLRRGGKRTDPTA